MENTLMWIDLPSLEAIVLGQYSLCGTKDYASCSLTLRSWIEMNDWLALDLPSLKTISSLEEGHSFCYPRSVILGGIGYIKHWMIRYSKSSKCESS